MGTGASVSDRYVPSIENGITVYHVEHDKEGVDRLLRAQKKRQTVPTDQPNMKGKCEASTIFRPSCRCWNRDLLVASVKSISSQSRDNPADVSIVSAFLRLGNIWKQTPDAPPARQDKNSTSVTATSSDQTDALAYEELFHLQQREDKLRLPGTHAEWIASINRWVVTVALERVTTDPRFVPPLRALIGNENWACNGNFQCSGKTTPVWQHLRSAALLGLKQLGLEESVSDLLSLIRSAKSDREVISTCHQYARSCIRNTAEWKALLPCLLPRQHRTAQFGRTRLVGRDVCLADLPLRGPTAETSLRMVLRAPECLQHWARLQHLELKDLGISGEIPPRLAALPALQHLDLSNNQLQGDPLPTCMAQLVHLKRLVLHHNRFSGSLAGTVLGAMHSLVHLELQHNSLSGTLVAIAALRRVEVVDVSHNLFEGPVPAAFEHMETLREISLHGNAFELPTPDLMPNLHKAIAAKSDCADIQPTEEKIEAS